MHYERCLRGKKIRMDNQNATISLKDSVLARIEDGGVNMRPKWHFVVTTVATGLGVAGAFFIVLFLTTFIIFALREAGTAVLPEFGAFGVRGFFLSLPWIPIVIALLFAVLLEVLLLRYAFAYRKPMLYSVLAVATAVALGSVLAGVAKVHERLYSFSETQQVPIVRPIYRSYVEPEFTYLHRGVISELQEHRFILHSVNGQTVIVDVDPDTRIVPTTAVRIGDFVVVLGQDQNGEVHAIGVHELPSRMMTPPMMPASR